MKVLRLLVLLPFAVFGCGDSASSTRVPANVTVSPSTSAYLPSDHPVFRQIARYLESLNAATSQQSNKNQEILQLVAWLRFAIEEWKDDEGYQQLHSQLASLQAIRAIGWEESAADGSLLAATWIVQLGDGEFASVACSGLSITFRPQPTMKIADFDHLWNESDRLVRETPVDGNATILDGQCAALTLMERDVRRTRFTYGELDSVSDVNSSRRLLDVYESIVSRSQGSPNSADNN